MISKKEVTFKSEETGLSYVFKYNLRALEAYTRKSGFSALTSGGELTMITDLSFHALTANKRLNPELSADFEKEDVLDIFEEMNKAQFQEITEVLMGAVQDITEKFGGEQPEAKDQGASKDDPEPAKKKPSPQPSGKS